MNLLPFGVTRQGTVLPSSQHFKYFFVTFSFLLSSVCDCVFCPAFITSQGISALQFTLKKPLKPDVSNLQS